MDDPPATRQPAPGAPGAGPGLRQHGRAPRRLRRARRRPGHGGLAGRHAATRSAPMRPSIGASSRPASTSATLIAVNSGQELPQPAPSRLARLLDAAAVHPVVAADGVRLASTARGVDGFLAALLAALVQATIDGSFRRLKVCRSDTCQWTFYDSSKNGCGAWCSMRSCGSRAKAKAYRERQRTDQAAVARRRRSRRLPAATARGRGCCGEPRRWRSSTACARPPSAPPPPSTSGAGRPTRRRRSTGCSRRAPAACSTSAPAPAS